MVILKAASFFDQIVILKAIFFFLWTLNVLLELRVILLVH
jgi:hypothetical protein